MVAGKEMYHIPLVLGLLQVTNLALPVSTPFENGIARYTALVSEDNDIVLNALERAGAERTGTSGAGEIEFAIDVPPEGLGDRLRTALRSIASAFARLRP